ncbi:hypothetical protein FOA52_014320 [Chlamydomonas sp. UWO 241]|nr:hypothetical protein FOA52_014320 [Chlamydomonas sp. UWO 241]
MWHEGGCFPERAPLRTVKMWHEGGCLPSEPYFVPASGAASEDDGALVSCVMGPDGASFMLVLDGRTMSEVARASVPYGVPYRFHGGFALAKK